MSRVLCTWSVHSVEKFVQPHKFSLIEKVWVLDVLCTTFLLFSMFSPLDKTGNTLFFCPNQLIILASKFALLNLPLFLSYLMAQTLIFFHVNF